MKHTKQLVWITNTLYDEKKHVAFLAVGFKVEEKNKSKMTHPNSIMSECSSSYKALQPI